MWTVAYHGAWIHGYCDRAECRVQWPDYTQTTCRSLYGAKALIRRRNKGT